MGRFERQTALIHQLRGRSGYSWIAFHRAVEAHARCVGMRFREVFHTYAHAHGFGREPDRWPTPDELLAATVDLERDHARLKDRLRRAEANQRAAKARGDRRSCDPFLRALHQARVENPVPRVSVWGWRDRRRAPPRIGSDDWDTELREIGVERSTVDEAIETGSPPSRRWRRGLPDRTLDAATAILDASRRGGRGWIVPLAELVRSGEDSEREWSARQLVALLSTRPSYAHAVWDIVLDPEFRDVLLPRFLALVPWSETVARHLAPLAHSRTPLEVWRRLHWQLTPTQLGEVLALTHRAAEPGTG